MIITGLFHCAAAIIDRFVENGVIERLEIDAALQSVEDNLFTDQYMALYQDDEARRWLAMPARLLRLINELGSSNRVMSTSEIRDILNFAREV
jgi:hypothetical protein